jgi:hypothetical protein
VLGGRTGGKKALPFNMHISYYYVNNINNIFIVYISKIAYCGLL